MRTLIPHVLAPVFVLVLMTFALLALTGYRRLGAVRAGEVRVGDIALGQNAWPPHALKASNAFNNQFQLPILFYALVAFALLTGKQDVFFIVCEWLFVLTRLVHAGIHVTSNNVMQRFAAYVAGFAILALMWVWYAIRILGAF